MIDGLVIADDADGFTLRVAAPGDRPARQMLR
jgi:hypothetical protein